MVNIVVMKDQIIAGYLGNGLRSKCLPPQGAPTTDSNLMKQGGFDSLYSAGGSSLVHFEGN